MENYEKLKERQKAEFTASVTFWKGKVKFSLISAIFFALVALNTAFNPMFSIYIPIICIILTFVFLGSAYHRNGYLRMHKNNIRMLDSIHKQIDKMAENFEDSDEFKEATKSTKI